MQTDLSHKVLPYLKVDKKRKGYFLLNEPHLLYLSDEQSNLYLDVMKSEDYSASFHGPTVEIINKALSDLFSETGKGVTLIDMGPGYPDKSLPMVRYLKDRQVPCVYVPVDISRSFLDIAAQHVRPYVERVHPVHAPFEECRAFIPGDVYRYTAFCMIGLTFMNFFPEKLLPLLKNIAGENGFVIVASELLTSQKSPDVVLASYRTREAQDFGFGPLKLLGLRQDRVTYQPQFVNGRVELQYCLTQDPGGNLVQTGMKSGDTVVTAVSYRYTTGQLSSLLEQYFRRHQMFISRDGGTALALARSV